MDRTSELCDFLRSRCVRAVPDQVDLSGPTRRRVKGLRREEVAALAGISEAYYTKLEQGKVAGVSGSVFDGIARALQLDEAERAYLAALLSVSGYSSPSRDPSVDPLVTPGLQRILAALGGVPAYIRNERFEVLAANALAEALYEPVFRNPARPACTVRFLFLEPSAVDFFIDWDVMTDQAVSYLRASAALAPRDHRLAELIAELATGSDVFARKWADHEVGFHQSGTKRFNNPIVGELTLDFQAFEVAGEPGLRLNAYTAPSGSPDAERLKLLGSWVATRVADQQRSPA